MTVHNQSKILVIIWAICNILALTSIVEHIIFKAFFGAITAGLIYCTYRMIFDEKLKY